jgi:uncharacterized OB-fold protein
VGLVPPPTIESFYKFCGDRKLMAAKCLRCKKVFVPPRSACIHCGSQTLEWAEISGKGRLVTYTVIHIAPAQFQSQAPYAIGIVEFSEGTRLPGMIRGVKLEDVKIGMELRTDFETSAGAEWPEWPRYFFTA